MRLKTMLKRYAAEEDIYTRDRMMLIIKITRDGMSINEAAKSLDMSPAWGIKWHRRYREVGFDNLADEPRSGRPPMVSKEDMKEIKKYACKEPSWTGRNMQEYIMEKTGVKYDLTHVRYILRGWGYSRGYLRGSGRKRYI